MLIAANLAPLVGVLWFGWDAVVVILVYWTENLVAGFYNILRMVFLRVDNPISHVGKILAIPFFVIHFGGFCAVHGVLLMALFMGDGAGDLPSMNGHWPGPLVFVGLLISVIAALWQMRPNGAEWIVASLMVSHGVSFVYNYFIRGEYASSTMGELMRRPYKRMVLLHVALVVGGVPIMMLGSPMPLLVILVLLKIVADVILHARSHRARRA